MINQDLSKLLIIADDFTGANDAGVQLTKKGAHVDVYFDWQHPHQTTAEVMVISTDSRAISHDDAKQRITQLINNNVQQRAIYKKIDSTLRGNLGAEIAATLISSAYQAAIVVPAFPSMKRVVKDGICYVDGIELIKTEFASDPKTPIYSSNVKACIAEQTTLPIIEIELAIIRGHQLQLAVTEQLQAGNRIMVLDAETEQDLQLIAQQLQPLYSSLLLVGSAGLIEHLPISYSQPSAMTKPLHKQPLLVIAGSMSLATQQQIEYALTQYPALWQVVDINIDDFLPTFSELKRQHYCQLITNALQTNKNVIVRTSQNQQDRHRITQYCQQYQLDRQTFGEHISQCLGVIVKHIAINNLFLTGGDVAIAIAKSLGAVGFQIQGEVATGIPYGKLLGDIARDYRIFTKAGGFGDENILSKSLQFI